MINAAPDAIQVPVQDVLAAQPGAALDEFQAKFCEEPSGAVRLLAPAGSGKTHCLLYRCLSLLDASGGDQLPRFLVFTFTRAAAGELRARLGNDPALARLVGRIEITTLNAWGYRRIRNSRQGLRLCKTGGDRYGCVMNVLRPLWEPNEELAAVLLDRRRQKRGVEAVIGAIDAFKALGFRHDLCNSREYVQEKCNWLKAAGIERHLLTVLRLLHDDLGVLAGSERDPVGVIYERFLRFWAAACTQMYGAGLVTYEDQKYWALHELDGLNAQGRSSTGMHRCSYILVDEFQDINVLDLQLLKAAALYNKAEITVVGDDDQAIYEWRGATPLFILNPEQFLGQPYVTHLLGINYRSPRNVVELSQRLIRHNTRRVKKNVVAHSDSDARIDLRVFERLSEALPFVEAEVRRLLRNPGIKSVALVSRKRSQIIPFQIVFARDGIPFYADDDLHVLLSRAFENFKHVLQMKLRATETDVLKADPVEDTLGLCDLVMRTPLSKSDRAGLNAFLRRRGPASTAEAVAALGEYLGPLKGENSDGTRSLSFRRAIRAVLETPTVAATIEAISEHFQGLQRDYGKSIEDIFYADPPFLYLGEYAEPYSSDYSRFCADLQEATNRTVRSATDDEDDLDPDWSLPLHLMTALRAKGREFDAVFILDANDGIWPVTLATTPEELEQERRLFYVAFTRARQRIYLLVNRRVMGQPVLPSPYLEEMGLLSGSGSAGATADEFYRKERARQRYRRRHDRDVGSESALTQYDSKKRLS